MVQLSVNGLERTILDLGVGTGKSLEAFMNRHHFERAVGCDFSRNMLKKAEERLKGKAELIACDFHNLPFPPNSFDIVTGSFMLRSVQNMDRFFSEVKRVLKPQGKVIFLELTRPRNPIIWSFFYKPYLQFYIPWIGKFFSRHDEAYRFLSESVRYFMTVEELKEKFLLAQFKSVSIALLTFGAAAVVEGKNE
jgi:demethylmenaquinone methyltransferase/2-methoxy-6-polyprenyl-1,4-benzoquinol methylase